MKKFVNLLIVNKKLIFVSLFLLIFCLIHLSLVSDTFFIDKSGNIHSSYEGYGDVPLHLTQISKFAFSQNFDLVDPIYFGINLQYPFFLNMVRGYILSFTHSWNFAVLWPLFFLVIVNAFLLFYVYKKVLRDNFKAILAFVLFYFGGGLGWIYIFSDKVGYSTTKLDTVYPAQNIDFNSPLFLVFMHQHTFLLGLFLTLLSIFLLMMYRERGNRVYLYLLILPFAIFPISHTHSFISAGLLLISFIAVGIFLKEKRFALYTFFVSALAFVLAIPQLLYLLSGKMENSFTTFRVGWMLKEGIGSVNFPNSIPSLFSVEFIHFILINFGLIIPLFIFGLVVLFVYIKKQKLNNVGSSIIMDFYLISFSFAGILSIILINLVQFQPWDFDNNKIVVYFLLFVSPLIVWSLSEVLKKNRVVKNVVMILVVVFLTLSGFVDLFKRIVIPKDDLPVVFKASAIEVADFIRVNVPENSLVLTGTSHINPVNSLAGRNALVGYPGWLWSRGIKYGERERKVNEFFLFPTKDNALFKEYPIGYILYDDTIRYQYKLDEDKLGSLFKEIFRSGEYVLYKI